MTLDNRHLRARFYIIGELRRFPFALEPPLYPSDIIANPSHR